MYSDDSRIKFFVVRYITMKKFLLSSLFIFFCNGSVLSNEFSWNKLVSSKDGSSDYYLDNKSTRTIGNYRYQWILSNKLKDNKKVKSNIDYATIDCKQNKLQVILITDYSEHFGKGKITTHKLLPEDQLEWSLAQPKTIMSMIIKNSCKNIVSSISSEDSESDLDTNIKRKKKKKSKYKEF